MEEFHRSPFRTPGEEMHYQKSSDIEPPILCDLLLQLNVMSQIVPN